MSAEPVNLPEPSLLQGVNVLIMGPTGTGKTHALATIAATGAEVFVLFTENGLETFIGYWTDQGLPIPPNVHWHVLSRPVDSFKTMALTATSINTMAQEALHKMQDVNRAKHNQYITLLTALSNFIDHRTGGCFGPVDSWGPDRVLCIDSLSGINPIVMSLVVGGKPVKSQADWGIAMSLIENLIRQLTDGCKCHVVMTAHVEREIDQVFGGVKISVATLGAKLAPKLPPMFSDVVLSTREGNKFSWSTAQSNADLKARNLPIADGIQPIFKQIFDKWKSRGGRFTKEVKV